MSISLAKVYEPPDFDDIAVAIIAIFGIDFLVGLLFKTLNIIEPFFFGNSKD
ncbi:MAG: hypothetical protein HEEMFOPI_01883 [Holosporales bacterium]